MGLVEFCIAVSDRQHQVHLDPHWLKAPLAGAIRNQTDRHLVPVGDRTELRGTYRRRCVPYGMPLCRQSDSPFGYGSPGRFGWRSTTWQQMATSLFPFTRIRVTAVTETPKHNSAHSPPRATATNPGYRDIARWWPPRLRDGSFRLIGRSAARPNSAHAVIRLPLRHASAAQPFQNTLVTT